MTVNTSFQLTVTVRDAAGTILTNAVVSWQTNDPSSVQVSATGLVTALATGSFTVLATVNNLSDPVPIEVSAGAPASVTVTPNPATLTAGDTVVLSATVRDAGGFQVMCPAVNWSSNNAAATIATGGCGVGGATLGRLVGVSAGSPTITATSGTVSGTASVTVRPPRPLPQFVGVTGGFMHTCGLTLQGDAYCWGWNNVGQLGLGTNTGPESCVWNGAQCSTVPRYLPGGLTFTMLSAGGGNHTCGVSTTNAAYCWGAGFLSQLGDGNSTERLSPTLVAGGLSFATVSAGGEHSCGLTTAGVSYCWGANGYGQVGDGNPGPRRPMPVPVANSPTFVQVAAGYGHSCGLTSSGAAYCWGQNDKGQLGDGTTTDRSTPVAVRGGRTFATISAGSRYTCAITATGEAYCWGYNWAGQLGYGSVADTSLPALVAGGQTFASLDVGWNHTCAVTTAGAAYCWGYNAYGQLGDGTTSQRLVPTPVSGGMVFARVAAGEGQSCGVTTGNVAYCWGHNVYGQVGIGTSSGPEGCTVNGFPCSVLPRKVLGQP